jgi:tetratricopeptide (TPR) repeat protein
MRFVHQRPVIVATIALIALVAHVLGRVAYESNADLAAAKAYQDANRIPLAVEHYRRAIRWSFPLSPYTSDAVSALQSIALQSEADGDVKGALSAWRSLSAGLAATRFLYSRSKPEIAHAHDQIARLVAMDRSAAIDANLSAGQLEADHRRLLGKEVSPDPWWGSLLLLGMAVWVGALTIMAWRGFDSAGRFHWASARGPLWGAMVGFISFVLGLLLA